MEMKDEEIMEILTDWNLWEKDMDSGLPREAYVKKAESALKSGMIAAITGPRRAGKSYIMRQAMKRAAEAHGKNSVLFINMEDARWKDYNPDIIMKAYEVYEKVMKPESRPVVFIDEVHRISGWERPVRTLHELGKADIMISGSSRKLLGKEFSSLLTGRHINIPVFPLGFSELLSFSGIKAGTHAERVLNKRKINDAAGEYLEWGGFPLVVLNRNRKEILMEYFEDIIQNDIIERHVIKETKKLRALAKFYMSNPASPITFQSAGRFLGIPASTVERFSLWMEEAYMIFFVSRFSHGLKEQENSPRKVYSIDNGLSSAIGFRTGANLGKFTENLAALRLKMEQNENPGLEVFYWKDSAQREVDFVLKEGIVIVQLIQVSYNVMDPLTKEREIKALLSASGELKCDNLTLITWDNEASENIGGKTVKFIPLRKWLLDGSASS
jgi:hypothetical protein